MRSQIEIRSYKDTAHDHSHQHTQIVLPLSGQLILDVENHQQPVAFGQACLISTQQAHTHLAEVENTCLVINNLPLWNSQLEASASFVELNAQARSYLPFLSSLSTESDTLKTHQALTLLEQLLPIPQEHITQADARVNKAKYILDHDFHSPWDLTSLALEVHLSSSQLAILFKRYMGATPKQYLLQRRLSEAKVWLASSNQSLDLIAEKVGLSSASTFVRVFNQRYQITPGQYRSQTRSKS